MTGPVVGFAGMTHLGLVSASAVAARGFATLCYDGDAKLIARLDAGDWPVLEPGLDELIRGNAGRQTFTARLDDLARCDVVYIALDVATDDEGRSDATALRALIDRVADALGPNALLVILSQVQPGFTRSLGAPPRERLYYQVETLVFGRAVERAMKPERYIVGCDDPGRPIDARLAAVLKAFACPILPMRYESAELAKIAINCCLVASISVANTLGELCERMGADWSEIAPALKLDRRIGPYAYLNPGLGISGGNLERDLRTILTIGSRHGTETGVVESWLHNSRQRKDWPWRTLRDSVFTDDTDAVVALLGLAYKENTLSTKNSPALRLLSHLQGRTVRVHDPVVPASVAPSAEGCATALDCLRGADVAVLITPWPEYREISIDALTRTMRGRVLIDPYRLLEGERAVAAGFTYHTLGRPALIPA